MKNRNPLFLGISLVLALTLSISLYFYLNSAGPQEEPTKTFTLLVARQEIPQYTKITTEMIETIQVLQTPQSKEAYVSDANELVGKYASDRILAGEPFYHSRILSSVAGNLALTLEEGHRAVSVMANLESGVAKLLSPGDYMDIIVSLPEVKELNVIIRPDISKLFLQRIQLLAIDQLTVSGPGSEAALTDKTQAATTESGSESVFYLTLSIPATHIEKLALAESIGRLKFALRPKGDDTLYPTDGTLWQELIERAIATGTTSAVETPKTKVDAPVITEPQSEEPAFKIYVVKPGDTLMNIARTELGDASQYKLLQEINNLANPRALHPGDRLKIPVNK